MAEEVGLSGIIVDPVRCISLPPQCKANTEAWKQKYVGLICSWTLKVCQEVDINETEFQLVWAGKENKRGLRGQGPVEEVAKGPRTEGLER